VYAKTRERRVGKNKRIAMQWMGIALVRRRPKKNKRAKFRISKTLSVSRGKREGPISQKENRPCPEFHGHAKNLMDFFCRHSLVFCASNYSQIGSPAKKVLVLF
jgi:hypothetical protein